MVKSWIFAAVVVAVAVSSVVFLGGYGLLIFLYCYGLGVVYKLEKPQEREQEENPFKLFCRWFWFDPAKG